MNKFTLKRNQKGFTLVELIIVIVILGILAAIAIPAMSNFIDDAKDREAESNCRNVYSAATAALADAAGSTEGSPSGTISNTSPVTASPGTAATLYAAEVKKLLGIAVDATSTFGEDGAYSIAITAATATEPAKITSVSWTGNQRTATYDVTTGVMTVTNR